jgi:hypothetical protein
MKAEARLSAAWSVRDALLRSEGLVRSKSSLASNATTADFDLTLKNEANCFKKTSTVPGVATVPIRKANPKIRLWQQIRRTGCAACGS